LPYYTAQGAVRVGFAKFWLAPAGTYLWHIGRKPVNRQLCQGSDARTPTLAATLPPKPKSGFFGSFLAKTRKEPPAAQALSSAMRRSFAAITNTATHGVQLNAPTSINKPRQKQSPTKKPFQQQ
jgi:hypothetical protein